MCWLFCHDVFQKNCFAEVFFRVLSREIHLSLVSLPFPILPMYVVFLHILEIHGGSTYYSINIGLQCSLKTTISSSLQQAQLHNPRAWVFSMAVWTMFAAQVLGYTARWSSEVLEHTLRGVSGGWVCIEMSFCFLAWQQVQQPFKATDLITFPTFMFDYAMHCHLAGFYWGETWKNVNQKNGAWCVFGACFLVQKLHKHTQYILQSSLEVEPFWHFPESKVPKMACSIVQYMDVYGMYNDVQCIYYAS